MARLGWFGRRQSREEDGSDAEATRREPGAGWPWIPRPATAGAAGGTSVAAGDTVVSPAVGQLEMAAAAPKATRKRGLGRRPKVLGDEGVDAPPSDAARPTEAEAAPEEPAAAAAPAASAAKPADPEPASAEDAAPPAPAGESTPEGEDTGASEGGAEEVAAGLAAMAGAGAADGGWRRWFSVARGPDGRRNWLGTKQVAAVVLLLLAAEVGYVVSLNVSSSSNKAATPPPLSTLPPVKQSAPTTTTPPKTAPAASPTTTAPPAKPAAAPVVQAAAAPLAPCTASDLDIATTTGQSAYSVGQDVNILTTVTDVRGCIFQPAPAGTYNCASSIVVASGGNQVWPASGQDEPCNPPAGMTMNPGSTESLTATWQATSAGTYEAVGMWGWSAGAGQPTNTANVASAPFTVS